MEKLGFLKPNVHFLLTARERFTRQAVTASLKFTSYSLLASSDQVANLGISLKNLAQVPCELLCQNAKKTLVLLIIIMVDALGQLKKWTVFE